MALDPINLKRVAAFSYRGAGGNPAGVQICDAMPTETEMLRVAKVVGYSETAFLHPQDDGWRVRYFAPEMEVQFCGHATIATGAVLGLHFGVGEYRLFLNEGEISVAVSESEEDVFTSTLLSPRTKSEGAPAQYVARMLEAFGFSADDLDVRFPVRFASAGAKHLIVVLNKRETLAGMAYAFDHVRGLMEEQGLVTINLLWAENDLKFHSRNPFAVGGVYEDPATGAAAAAFAGYLRDIGWRYQAEFEVLQGEDMGSASRLLVAFGATIGEGVKVTGETRFID